MKLESFYLLKCIVLVVVMYIRSIVLEGFKSYAGRTEISGLDRHFTAITGLNGSGKSNILDAICFVLASSIWGSYVHTPCKIWFISLAALEATVSITLDNSDKRNGPPGYVFRLGMSQEID